MAFEFAPELVLEDDERINLAIVQANPGFRTLLKVLRSAVDSFTLALINTPEDSPEVVSRHRSAKVAAQLYTSFVQRVNNEVERYVMAPKPTDLPIDPTAVLDMGGIGQLDDEAEELWR